MKPVLVLQNLSADGPAYLGTWLRERGIAYDVRNTEAGGIYPAAMDGHCALAVLGGAMSANDPLPSLRQAERLILEAMQRSLPVIGHCLGGQLMARALGAQVRASPRPEIGWQHVEVKASAAAQDWFGQPGQQRVMQWHYDAFDLPAGAELLAHSEACPVQAFAIGPHLAMQFHIEVDEAKLQVWTAEQSEAWEHAESTFNTVQGGPCIRALAAAALPPHQALARRIYSRWLNGTPWAAHTISAL